MAVDGCRQLSVLLTTEHCAKPRLVKCMHCWLYSKRAACMLASTGP